MQIMLNTSDFVQMIKVCKPFVARYDPWRNFELQHIYCEVHENMLIAKACNGTSMIELQVPVVRCYNEVEDFNFYIPTFVTNFIDIKLESRTLIIIEDDRIWIEPMKFGFYRVCRDYPKSVDIDSYIAQHTGSTEEIIPNHVGIDPKLLNRVMSAFKSERVVKLTTCGIESGILIQSEHMRAFICAKRISHLTKLYKEA